MTRSDLNIKNIDSIIFDFDGVILDSLDAKTDAYYSMYKKYGNDIAKKVKKYHVENGGVSRFEKFKFWHKEYLNIDLTETQIKKLSNQYSKMVLKKVLKSEEVKGSVNFIRNYYRNFKFFIVSGTPDYEIKLIVKKLNLNSYFHEVLGSPNNKNFWCDFLIKKYNLNTKRTIFIGDAKSDFYAAQKFGINFCLRKTIYNYNFFKKKNCLKFENFIELKMKLKFPQPNVLITSTSFQDSPGRHKEFLTELNWKLSYLRGPLQEKEIISHVSKYDVIICGDDEYTENVIKKGFKGKLKVLSKYGVGLDKINLDAAEKYNIPVKNCPGINQVSVAEHVFALILAYEKNIYVQNQDVQNYKWNRKVGNQIDNKTIGIIGFGSIGQEVARISKAFNLNVLVYDPYVNNNKLLKKLDVKKLNDLNGVLIKSDYITLHTPLNSKTKNIINNKSLSFVNKNSILINTARAGLVDANSIVSALNNGKLRGYLTDVLDREPVFEGEQLVGNNKVIITPHVGSRTYQNIENQGLKAIHNAISLLE
tara:strand:+ start:4251 stop:5852 length:1602 start_codon:yes stop_codon:yes gene_type:complete